MCFIVPSIVGGVYEQNSIVNSVHVDDWTVEWAIIASSDLNYKSYWKTATNIDNHDKKYKMNLCLYKARTSLRRWQ